jgi:hypothetical protein
MVSAHVQTQHAEPSISETLPHFLVGHALEGVSAKYIAELLITHGPALREAQEKISKRVFELLGLTLGTHHDAPLVPSMSTRSVRPTARRRSKAAAPCWHLRSEPNCLWREILSRSS